MPVPATITSFSRRSCHFFTPVRAAMMATDVSELTEPSPCIFNVSNFACEAEPRSGSKGTPRWGAAICSPSLGATLAT